MEHMQEYDFDNIQFDTPVEECDHSYVVKLYDDDTFTDYGCASCGAKSSDPDDFD